jgi:superfamily II DNA/RNA helicase
MQCFVSDIFQKPPLTKQAFATSFAVHKNYMPFAKLGLTRPLLRGVQSMGYGDPTPIQLRAIAPALEGRDVISSAQTGTGKTAAFAVPLLQHLGAHGPLRCLVLEATLPPEIADLAAWALRDPTRVEIGAGRPVAAMVTHGVYSVEAERKFDLLVALLEATDYQSVLVFARTKHGADKIAKKLRNANHAVAILHANRTQNQRIEALSGFKSGKYEVMVATDIAARGIDVAGESHVINYDVPQHPEDYVHRIGRTGRALRTGDAFTLVTRDELKKLAAIERFIGQRIERLSMDGFALAPAPSRNEEKSFRPRVNGFTNRRAFQRTRQK